MMSEYETAVPAKPRLILMGEFSSGKSTLSNILLGTATLPTQITATRLPPVYISYGEPGAHAINRDGAVVEVDLAELGRHSPEHFRSLHLTMISDTLELCDLVDMPGISDPNMPTDTWDSVVGPSDTVIWCTHATQAWRQSEAAMWDRMREATSGLNLLLITQFDKLRNPRDRKRVLHRVASETEGKFTAVYPVALLEALKAGEDFEIWKDSGADAFMQHLIEILLAPRDLPEDVTLQAAEAALPETDDALPEVEAALPDAVAIRLSDAQEEGDGIGQEDVFHFANPAHAAEEGRSAPHDAVTQSEIRVIPRRVRARSDGDSLQRPPRPANREGWTRQMEPGAI
jgi:hypothetical protein